MIDKINPFIKLVTVMVCGILLIFSSSWRVNLLVIITSILFLMTSKKITSSEISRILVPVSIISLSFFFSGWFFGDPGSPGSEILAPGLGNGIYLGTRVLAFASLGILFSLTTDTKKLLASLVQQGNFSNKMAYGALSSINLFPSMQEKYQEANLAYKVRQVQLNKVDHRPLIGLLVRAIRWSDSLAMAMNAKGFSEERTHYVKTSVHSPDLVFLILYPLVILLGLIFLQ